MSRFTEQPAHASGAQRHAEGRRGSILVAVLAVTAFLALILAAFLEDAVSKIKYHGLFHNSDQLRARAYSALEISLAVMNTVGEIDLTLNAPAQGWGDPLRFAEIDFAEEGLQVNVAFEDEGAKFPLAEADFNLLRAAFEEIGFEYDVAEELVPPLLDWVDEDDDHRINGFDGEDYEDMDPPFRAPNRPIQSWDELEHIYGWREVFWDEKGAPTPELAVFKSMFSLENTGPVNINTAPPRVLNVIARLHMFQPEALLDYLAGPDLVRGTEDDRFIEDPDDPLMPIPEETAGEDGSGAQFGIESSLYRVNVTVSRGEATFLLSALVEWQGGADVGAGQTQQQQNEDTRRRPTRRGATAEETDKVGQLGYPFKIVRLRENLRQAPPEFVRQYDPRFEES